MTILMRPQNSFLIRGKPNDHQRVPGRRCTADDVEPNGAAPIDLVHDLDEPRQGYDSIELRSTVDAAITIVEYGHVSPSDKLDQAGNVIWAAAVIVGLKYVRSRL